MEIINNFYIEVVTSKFLLDHWSQIETAILENFKDVDFYDDFTTKRPAEHTWLGATGKLNRQFVHIIAFENSVIVGALFCIPSDRKTEEIECDLGWFFTSKCLAPIKKIKLGDLIMNKVHQILTEKGFEIIVTEMGTKGGATFMSKRYGYIHSPFSQKENRWIKKLI